MVNAIPIFPKSKGAFSSLTTKNISARLVSFICTANILYFFTYHLIPVFWYINTCSMLILIGISSLTSSPLAKWQNKAVIPGIVTGIATYLIFLLGNFLLQCLFPSLHQQVLEVYRQLSPNKWWHYVVLCAVFVPAEELFWRGVIQRLLMKIFHPCTAVMITGVLNGAALIYSGFLILPIAAFVCALIWGSLYINKNSIFGVLLAHLTFDLLLLVMLPLH
jgi:uncharacterized protein